MSSTIACLSAEIRTAASTTPAKPCAASVVTNFRRNADDSLTTSYVLAGSLQLTVSKSSGLSRSSSRSASCQL
jgi:hypothetical protein